MNKVEGSVFSSFGFYVGDPCYVLDEVMYYQYWGGEHNFKDGVFRADSNRSLTKDGVAVGFAVSGTAYGDGTYTDQYGRQYGVDSGTIALVSLELVKDIRDAAASGCIIQMTSESPFEAHFEEEGGVFNVTLQNGYKITIDTTC